jgi:hypothetical protein
MTYDVVGIIQERIEEVFDDKILWQTEFNTTVRKYSKEIILAGVARDTRDQAKVSMTEGYQNSFSIEECDIHGIVIVSDDPDTEFINDDRPELEDYIIDNIDLEEVTGMLISNYFETLNL